MASMGRSDRRGRGRRGRRRPRIRLVRQLAAGTDASQRLAGGGRHRPGVRLLHRQEHLPAAPGGSVPAAARRRLERPRLPRHRAAVPRRRQARGRRGGADGGGHRLRRVTAPLPRACLLALPLRRRRPLLAGALCRGLPSRTRTRADRAVPAARASPTRRLSRRHRRQEARRRGTSSTSGTPTYRCRSCSSAWSTPGSFWTATAMARGRPSSPRLAAERSASWQALLPSSPWDFICRRICDGAS